MDETVDNGFKRNEDGTFAQGTAPGPGRPPETPESLLVKKALKQLVEEYKEVLAEVLPALAPVLKEKALSGDVPAIKELHDRVMDKPAQSSTMRVELPPVPIMSLDGVQRNNSNQEDKGSHEEN